MANKLLQTLTIDGTPMDIVVSGDTYAAAASVKISAATTVTKGAALNLDIGKYMVVSGFEYGSATSTGARTCRTYIYVGNTSYVTISVVSANNNAITQQVVGIVTISADGTEVSVRGISDKTTSTNGTTYVRVIKIA